MERKFELEEFAEKYKLAVETSKRTKPEGGLCGLEIEWNLLDSQFHPLLTVGSGPDQHSFVDYLRGEFISPRLREFSQLEVFHWMIEWATRPYFQPRAVIYEARLMEGVLINSLSKAGKEFTERFYTWHGNLPFLTTVSNDSIPGSWHIAKRRYLEQCIELYGESIATTGTHSNLSLPDALFEWDFMKLPTADRTGVASTPIHIDQYKSQFYIRATGLMRAFACLFISTSAATPFRAGSKDGQPVVYLSNFDSVRNLTFPNPANLDLPDLYNSLEGYLNLSYDLVRHGIRFGNNNWTPVRARSFAEPVERLIDLTSEQLHELYGRGLFVLGQDQSLDEMISQIEMQNLLARINLPMARVEVRTDDGGNPLDLEVANMTLKHLLLIKFYADRGFAASFHYDQGDIKRARVNEELAAKQGLRSEIKNPFTKKPMNIREFLNWTLEEVQPLAEMLGLIEELTPLKVMASGGTNTAERLRKTVCEEITGISTEACEAKPVPLELLRSLEEEREAQIAQDVENIAETYALMEEDRSKIEEILQYCREDVHQNPIVPIRFRPRPEAIVEVSYPDKLSEIISIAKRLIEIPSVTVGAEERVDELRRAATFIYDFLRNHGIEVNYYNQNRYPAILASFPGQSETMVMLSGHFDVVAPEPDETQFEPRLDGDYLWGRGSADMKTVLATYLVWMKDQLKTGAPHPPINLLLVGNEEIGETEPMGTPHVLDLLREAGNVPQLLIAGERTGESGNELWGEICVENRGVMRFEIIAKGHKGHTGTKAQGKEVSVKLLEARLGITHLLENHLTINAMDGWRSQVNFPFIEVGKPGVYNISPDIGRLGVEIRPIPQDNIDKLYEDLQIYCESNDLELQVSVKENGIACDPKNEYLLALIQAVRQTSHIEPRIGKKLPGTSARFAPNGQGVVWGQSGLGPHANDERHYVPSIMPYYNALIEYAQVLQAN